MRFGLVLFISLSFSLYSALSNATDSAKAPFKILHVMSYHQTWEWNIEQFQGFKDGIGDLNIEYKVIELDTKRNSDPAAIAKLATLATTTIEQWQPDLLYTNDDNAQKYVAQHYVGTDLPIVFSAVNRDPLEYGFMGAANVTGVMEYEHIIPTINLLREIKGDIKRIAVIIDDDPTWRGVITRMRSSLKQLSDVEITSRSLILTFDEYKKKIIELQDQVDAIALLGVFNLKDNNGNDMDYEHVLKWTADNSRLPDFSFWESRVDSGTLCAVAVSGYEQGYLAGEIARKILHDGIAPSSIKISPTLKGEPMISLPRAKALDIPLNVQMLLNNTIKNKYSWEER
jgi:ABC-type uncharacterized transport system substrate-binding protein